MTQWFYQGEDNRIYGPASAQDMLSWYQAGYFDNDLQCRTETDSAFHPLFVWIKLCGGQVPFTLPLTPALEAMAMARSRAVMNSNGQSMTPVSISSGASPFMVYPPGFGPPPANLLRPMYITHPGFAMQPTTTTTIYQELSGASSSSEAGCLADEALSSVSQTPESDQGWSVEHHALNGGNGTPMQNMTMGTDKCVDTSCAVWNMAVSNQTQTMGVDSTSVHAQTEPIEISAEIAAGLLCRLLGLDIRITN